MGQIAIGLYFTLSPTTDSTTLLCYVVKDINCQNPNLILTQRLGIMWKWLYITTTHPPQKLNVSNISAVTEAICQGNICHCDIVHFRNILDVTRFWANFWGQILGVLNFRGPTFFWTKLLLTNIFFGPNKFLYPKYLLFWPKYSFG